MRTEFTLVIERTYSTGAVIQFPAFTVETREEADELLQSYPTIYAETSRQIVECRKEKPCSETRLRAIGC